MEPNRQINPGRRGGGGGWEGNGRVRGESGGDNRGCGVCECHTAGVSAP